MWFVIGLAFGVVLMGFCTIGSFDRGADSARQRTWKMELVARKRAAVMSRSRHAVLTAFVPELRGAALVAAALNHESPRPVAATERRTRIRRDQGEVLTHIAL